MREWKCDHPRLTVWQQASDDILEWRSYAADLGRTLERLSAQNADVEIKDDGARIKELNFEGCGIHVGVGGAHGDNVCLADSLLQALAAKRICGDASKALLDGSPKARAQRSLLCIEAPRHLAHHADHNLHPCVRDDLGRVIAHADHDRALLEHAVHSQELVQFFLNHFRSSHQIEPRGVKIVVYTRFDSEVLDHLLLRTFLECLAIALT